MTTDLTRRIESPEQLVEHFQAAVKLTEERMIGMEYERLPVFSSNGEAVPYAGEKGIERLLLLLSERFGWTTVHEGERVIALTRHGSSVTLEPGAQFELSSATHQGLCELCREVSLFIEECRLAAEELGISLLGLGLQPFTPLDQINWTPKRRYQAMREILPPKGRLAPVMMKQTAGIQVSLDYTSEEDAMEQLALSLRLSPLVTAIFANSPLTEGRPNGYQSYRARVWRETDPDRCGLLPWALEKGRGFRDYVDYILDTPLMFIVREGEYLRTNSLTFRQFIRNGFEGHLPTMVDWETALTQVFPEVRLKNYVEIRSADSQISSLALAIPALWVGILYGEGTRPAVREIMGGFSFEELDYFHEEASRQGLQARLGRFTARELAEKILSISRRGLEGIRTACNEVRYLERIEALVHEGLTPADLLLQRWEEAKGDRARLVEEFSGGLDCLCSNKSHRGGATFS